MYEILFMSMLILSCIRVASKISEALTYKHTAARFIGSMCFELPILFILYNLNFVWSV